MPTHHHPHDHALPMKEHALLYGAVWALAIAVVGLELAGAWLSGSHALLADVGHVLSDTVLALVPLLALGAMRFGINGKKVSLWASYLAVVILVWIGMHVGYEALTSLAGAEHEHHHVEGWLLFFFSSLAAGVNLIQHSLLSRIDPIHRHGAHTGLHFHVLMDLVKNLALPLLGVLIALNLLPHSADLYAAVFIGALLIIRAIVLLIETLRAKQVH